MKNNKGITLISLMMYIIGMVAIAAIISVAVSFYNKNVLTMNDTSDVNMEFNKFDTKMVQETKTAGNQVEAVTTNTIKFTSGNAYTFQDNRIYQNEIVVSNYVKEFIAKLETEGSKQILRIYILLGKGQIEVVKNLSYVVEGVEEELGGSATIVVQGSGTVPEVNEDGLATENFVIKPDASSDLQIVIPVGFAPAILATGTTQSGPRTRWKCKRNNAG